MLEAIRVENFKAEYVEDAHHALHFSRIKHGLRKEEMERNERKQGGDPDNTLAHSLFLLTERSDNESTLVQSLLSTQCSSVL